VFHARRLQGHELGILRWWQVPFSHHVPDFNSDGVPDFNSDGDPDSNSDGSGAMLGLVEWSLGFERRRLQLVRRKRMGMLTLRRRGFQI